MAKVKAKPKGPKSKGPKSKGPKSKGPKSKGPKPKGKPSRKLVGFLPGVLCLLIAAAWLADLPGVWRRLLASRALGHSRPHVALDWLDAHDSEPPTDVPELLLAVRAYMQLNMSSQASALLQVASNAGLDAQQKQIYRDMISAHRGDAEAADRLTSGQLPGEIPPEAYEAILRCALYHGNFDRLAVTLDYLESAEGSRSGIKPALFSYYKGRMAEVQEDYPTAASHFEAAFLQEPNLTSACFRSAFCRLKTGEFQLALRQVEKMQDPLYSAITSIEKANCLWEMGEFEDAKSALGGSLAKAPEQLIQQYVHLDEYVDTDRAALVAARIEDSLGRPGTAVQLLQRVLDFNNRNFEARSLLVKNFRALGRLDEAKEIAAIQTQMIANRQRCQKLRDELEGDPLNLEKRCELAELYWTTESEAEARLAIEEIFQIDPQCLGAKNLLRRIEATKRE